MKVIILFALLMIAAGCSHGGQDGDVPMLITNWEHAVSHTDVVAVIGNDQPVPVNVAAYMLEAIGHTMPSHFAEEPWLTMGHAQDIIRRVNPTGQGIALTEDNQHAYISYALWTDIFVQILDQLTLPYGVQAVNIIPVATVEGHTITNIGRFGGKPINLGAFFNQEIRILHKDMNILAVLGVVDTSPTLANVVVTHGDAFGASVLVHGVTRNYVYGTDVAPIVLPDGEPALVSLHIHGQEIIGVTMSDTAITGTIERLSPNTIELKEWGMLPLCPFFTVYDQNFSVRPHSDLLVGEDMATFYMIDGRVGAAIITRNVVPTEIRVALSTTGFGGLIHNHVIITSTGGFSVRGGDRVENFAPNQTFSVSQKENDDLWGSPRLYITTDAPEDKLQVLTIGRNWPDGQHPKYRGLIEISHHESGGFILINELCIEAYLYAVIPSEMPASHGLEAAKVQAITARSFAMQQIYQNTFRAFGAHVCDSVISQVYNNIPETEMAIAAVDATRNWVLAVEGNLVTANYFSTSSGMTANAGEVWGSGGQFPGVTPIHLQSTPQFYLEAHNPGNLREETYAAAFFRNGDIPSIDQNFPWFRWQTRLTVEDLTRSINGSLAPRQMANPAMIQALNQQGEPTGATVNTIGQLVSMEVVSRGQGGNIMDMRLTGTDNTVLVRTEFNIRTLLNPGQVPVLRQDGSTVTNLSLMPSAFFTMEMEKDAAGHLIAVTFFGGGNGHGVGMSQNGVRTLVERGMTYREILRHYYPHADVIYLGC